MIASASAFSACLLPPRSSGRAGLVRGYSAVKSTEYTIECPPSDPETLATLVEKHIKTQSKYVSSKPVAEHTSSAFAALQAQLAQRQQHERTSKVVLDSGCGTGRSSLLLGKKFPEHVVIGVDRSIARLSRNPVVNAKTCASNVAQYSGNPSGTGLVQKAADNVWLVRAELVDFWRCCNRENWYIDQHYLLYPNPYPKKRFVKRRWYAHPSFPTLLELQANTIVLRSNWKQYLQEFLDAVQYANACYAELGPERTRNYAQPYLLRKQAIQLQDGDVKDAWTNFEQKYFDAEEHTFELILHRNAGVRNE